MSWPSWLTADFYKGIWADFVEYLGDLPIKVLKGVLDAIATIFQGLPKPDFLTQHSLAATMGPVMSDIGFFLSSTGLSTALSLITAALLFRITRKILTFGA